MPCNTEIGFAVADRYNASAILFDNLIAGSHRLAVIGPAGSRTYGELAADAVAFGACLLSLGLQRGDRVLLFLDDTPLIRPPSSALLTARKAFCGCAATPTRPSTGTAPTRPP